MNRRTAVTLILAIVLVIGLSLIAALLHWPIRERPVARVAAEARG